MKACGRVNDRHAKRRARSLAKSQVKVEQRRQAKAFQRDAVSGFYGEVAREYVVDNAGGGGRARSVRRK